MIGSLNEQMESQQPTPSNTITNNTVSTNNNMNNNNNNNKIVNFFSKRPTMDSEYSTKRVKSVPLADPAIDRPLRAPSPVILSPEQAKEIASRKMEAIHRMEAKRLARNCVLEHEHMAESWLRILEPEFTKAYFVRLKEFLQSEWDRSIKIFPIQKNIYSWTRYCSIDQVKVVILGQDPYHNDGQAMGLAFSVPRECRPLPPSLRNIYKELTAEYPNGAFVAPKHGCLENWAQQGVLMLNATLTVKAHEAASHANRGWETFTDQVICHLNSLNQPIVFLLWGNHAQKKSSMLNNKQNHLVLTAAHPSPLSASRGFFGCNHFIKTNTFLQEKGLEPINWNKFDEDESL